MKDEKYQFISKAYDFFDNSFGMVVTFEDIKEDPESFASIFCEGSVALRNLLLDLWENNIETRGCCKGHDCVHTYIKTGIFKKEEYVCREEYEAHKGSRRYKDLVSEAHAYVAFRPGYLGDAQHICNKIEGRMKERLPQLTYATNTFPDLITISLDKYVEPAERELFFSVLSDVFEQDIYISNKDEKYVVEETKNNSLDVLINNAERKRSQLPVTKDSKIQKKITIEK